MTQSSDSLDAPDPSRWDEDIGDRLLPSTKEQ
jgi:hypothetical protein